MHFKNKLYMLNFTKSFQYLQFRLVAKYAELSEKFVIVTSISHLVN